jgi:hypothetical protein
MSHNVPAVLETACTAIAEAEVSDAAPAAPSLGSEAYTDPLGAVGPLFILFLFQE